MEQKKKKEKKEKKHSFNIGGLKPSGGLFGAFETMSNERRY